MEGKSFGNEYQDQVPQPPEVPEGAADAYNVNAAGSGDLITEGPVDEDGHVAVIFVDDGKTAEHYNDFLKERGLDGFFAQKEVPGQEG